MAKRLLVDNHVGDFLDEAARDYAAFTGGDIAKAKGLYVTMLLGQELTRRLAPVVAGPTMAAITREPAELFRFATNYFRAKRNVPGYEIVFGQEPVTGFIDEADEAASWGELEKAAGQVPAKIKKIIAPGEREAMKERDEIARIMAEDQQTTKRLKAVKKQMKVHRAKHKKKK